VWFQCDSRKWTKTKPNRFPLYFQQFRRKSARFSRKERAMPGRSRIVTLNYSLSNRTSGWAGADSGRGGFMLPLAMPPLATEPHGVGCEDHGLRQARRKKLIRVSPRSQAAADRAAIAVSRNRVGNLTPPSGRPSPAGCRRCDRSVSQAPGGYITSLECAAGLGSRPVRLAGRRDRSGRGQRSGLSPAICRRRRGWLVFPTHRPLQPRAGQPRRSIRSSP